jgi:hypothetical protein
MSKAAGLSDIESELALIFLPKTSMICIASDVI